MNELKGKTDDASHDSVTEQASEVFDNFFETVKDEIKNENKEFNVALIKFIKKIWNIESKPERFCISKFWYDMFR